jgi:hypothetical protein
MRIVAFVNRARAGRQILSLVPWAQGSSTDARFRAHA